MALLKVRGLKTYFYTDNGIARAVDGVNLEVDRGQSLGIVGESGCGKTVASLSIMRLIPSPPGRIEDGEVIFKEKDLLRLSEEQMRRIRGNEISMIFQEPMTSLNPVFTCGNQIEEVLRLHQKLDRKVAWTKAVELLDMVGIPSPEQTARQYPHQLSGGMQQRVVIGVALACNPSLLIADEPTTALDVTIQAQILELLKRLQEEFQIAIILITHDLGVIAKVAHRVAVMYAGKIVEHADVEGVFSSPLHPYTKGLLESMLKLTEARPSLPVIEGLVPDAVELPPGCRFHPRCREAVPICREKEPDLKGLDGDEHLVRCWMA